MLDVFKVYATDEKKELAGVEIPLGGGAFITVARANNDNFLKKIIEESDLHLAEIKSLPKEEASVLDKQILCKVLAETVLLDFKGLSYDGKAIKYSLENAAKLLAIKDFRKLVMTHADNLENFRLVQEAKDTKNL